MSSAIDLYFSSSCSQRVQRSAASFDFNSAYTAIAHIRLSEDTDTYSHFIAIGGDFDRSAGQVDCVGTGSDGTTLRAYIQGASSADLSGSTSLTPEEWYRIAMRRNSATSFEVLLNGSVEISSSLNVGGRTAATEINLFNYYYYGLCGRIANFRLWQAALSDSEIAAEFASASAVRTSGLWCSLPSIGEDVADLIVDESGNGRDFAVVDGSNPIGIVSIADGPEFVTVAKSLGLRPYLPLLVR